MPVAVQDLLERCPWRRRNRDPREVRSRRVGAKHRVVVNDHDTVKRPVHVEFDRVGSTLNGTQEAGERVLAQLAGSAAVSDVLDGVRHRPGR